MGTVNFHSDYAAAFNSGSDARIAGEPLRSNPHMKSTDSRRAWVMGWRHADIYWGQDARRPVRGLPAVTAAAVTTAAALAGNEPPKPAWPARPDLRSPYDSRHCNGDSQSLTPEQQRERERQVIAITGLVERRLSTKQRTVYRLAT